MVHFMELRLYFLMLCLSVAVIGCENSTEKSSSKKGIKDGVVKQYRAGNILKNEITYKDGKRHGLAKTYYKDGKLRQQIDYVNGQKHGDAITYYEHGKVFQSTPYVSNKIQGIRKKYRKNGQLMAEVPYHNGLPCSGLKEYLLDGSQKRKYPRIVFDEKNTILVNGKFHLEVKMSDGSKRVDFYVNTPLSKDGCLLSDHGARSNYKPGVLKLSYNLPAGGFVMEEVRILAVVKTKLGNPYITEAKHNLAIENRGY